MATDAFEKFFARMNQTSEDEPIRTREEDLEDELAEMRSAEKTFLERLRKQYEKIQALTAEVNDLRRSTASSPQIEELKASLARVTARAERRGQRLAALRDELRSMPQRDDIKVFLDEYKATKAANEELKVRIRILEEELAQQRRDKEDLLTQLESAAAKAASSSKRPLQGEGDADKEEKRQRVRKWKGLKETQPLPDDLDPEDLVHLAKVVSESMRLLLPPGEYEPPALEKNISFRLSPRDIERVAALDAQAYALLYDRTRTPQAFHEELVYTVGKIRERDEDEEDNPEDRTYNSLMNRISAFHLVTANVDQLFEEHFSEFYITYMLQSTILYALWNPEFRWVESAGSERRMATYLRFKDTEDANVEEMKRALQQNDSDDDEDEEEDEDYKELSDDDEDDDDEEVAAVDDDEEDDDDDDDGEEEEEEEKEEEEPLAVTKAKRVKGTALAKREIILEQLRDQAYASIPNFEISTGDLAKFWARLLEYVEKDTFLEKHIRENSDKLWFYVHLNVNQTLSVRRAVIEVKRVERLIQDMPSDQLAEFAAENFSGVVDLRNWNRKTLAEKDDIIAQWHEFFDTPRDILDQALKKAFPGRRSKLSNATDIARILDDIDREILVMVDADKDSRIAFAKARFFGSESGASEESIAGVAWLIKHYDEINGRAHDYLFRMWKDSGLDAFDKGTVSKAMNKFYPGARPRNPIKNFTVTKDNKAKVLQRAPAETSATSLFSSATSEAASSSSSSSSLQNPFAKRIGGFVDDMSNEKQEVRTLFVGKDSARFSVQHPVFNEHGNRAYFSVQRDVDPASVRVSGAPAASVAVYPFSRPSQAEVTRFARTPGNADFKVVGTVRRVKQHGLHVEASDGTVWVFDTSDESIAIRYTETHEIEPHISFNAQYVPLAHELSYQFLRRYISSDVSAALNKDALEIIVRISNILADDITGIDNLVVQVTPETQLLAVEAERESAPAYALAKEGTRSAGPVLEIAARYIELPIMGVDSLPTQTVTSATARSLKIKSLESVAYFRDIRSYMYPEMWKFLELDDPSVELFDMRCRVPESIKDATLYGTQRVYGDRIPMKIVQGKLPVVRAAFVSQAMSDNGMRKYIVTLDVSDSSVDEILIGVQESIQGEPAVPDSASYVASRVDVSERFWDSRDSVLVSIRKENPGPWLDRVQVSYHVR